MRTSSQKIFEEFLEATNVVTKCSLRNIIERRALAGELESCKIMMKHPTVFTSLANDSSKQVYIAIFCGIMKNLTDTPIGVFVQPIYSYPSA